MMTRAQNVLFSKIAYSILTRVIIKKDFPLFMVINEQFHVNKVAF